MIALSDMTLKMKDGAYPSSCGTCAQIASLSKIHLSISGMMVSHFANFQRKIDLKRQTTSAQGKLIPARSSRGSQSWPSGHGRVPCFGCLQSPHRYISAPSQEGRTQCLLE